METSIMEDQRIQFERYKIAVEQVRWEGNLGWDNFRTFLIVHTIFIGFLLKGVFEKQGIYSGTSFFISIIGILLCIPWVATKMRNHRYYIFRMAQARELEPDDWNYFRGKGQEFSDGKSVEVQGKTHKMFCLERVIKKPLATTLIIAMFLFVYLLIAIGSYINVEIAFAFNKITLEGRQILKIISIALALLGIFFLTFGLKLVQSYSKELNKDLKIDEKELIVPSFVSQRTYSIIIGLCMIIISACIQLAIVMWK